MLTKYQANVLADRLTTLFLQHQSGFPQVDSVSNAGGCWVPLSVDELVLEVVGLEEPVRATPVCAHGCNCGQDIGGWDDEDLDEPIEGWDDDAEENLIDVLFDLDGDTPLIDSTGHSVEVSIPVSGLARRDVTLTVTGESVRVDLPRGQFVSCVPLDKGLAYTGARRERDDEEYFLVLSWE